jgi:hypothetical protein
MPWQEGSGKKASSFKVEFSLSIEHNGGPISIIFMALQLFIENLQA